MAVRLPEMKKSGTYMVEVISVYIFTFSSLTTMASGQSSAVLKQERPGDPHGYPNRSYHILTPLQESPSILSPD